MAALTVAAFAFVGSHFLLSHPLRLPLVSRLGEQAFRGFYSLIALLTFAAMLWAYHALGRQGPLWLAGEGWWAAGAILMWSASILFAGSFVGNPALPGARAVDTPKGVLAITRHPMMWSFAIWAVVHAALIATPKALVLDAAILILALGGAYAQDRKKRGQMGQTWHGWSARTAFIPFARGLAWPGAFAAGAGTLLFVVATWLHPLPVAVWRWF